MTKKVATRFEPGSGGYLGESAQKATPRRTVRPKSRTRYTRVVLWSTWCNSVSGDGPFSHMVFGSENVVDSHRSLLVM